MAVSAGDDNILGTPGNDTINGLTGNDTLLGEGGNDSIDGGDGNDSLLGGDGDDTIWSGPGNDTVSGGAGNDSIYTGSGVKRVDGGAGDDYISLFLTSGAATVTGGDGDDFIIGGSGPQVLNGGPGNDLVMNLGFGSATLGGGTGIDQLIGGSGNDTFIVDSIDTYISDPGGVDRAIVYADYVKIPSSIETVEYRDGARALPYWIGSLLPDEAAGRQYTHLLDEDRVIRFAFPASLPSYDDDPADANGFLAFNAAQQAFARKALAYISTVIDVQFVETQDANALDVITFAYNNQAQGQAGYAYNPGADPIGSDVFFSRSSSNLFVSETGPSALTFMHEIGHALGLKHPGDYGLGEEGPFLPSDDSTQWTVMSYNVWPFEPYRLAYSPVDIAALQYLYGPSRTARTGNDRYVVDPAGGQFIWDGGGNDTLDGSAVTSNLHLSLEPGYGGYAGSRIALTFHSSSDEITVNFGTVIENLLGGWGNDELTGNASANFIGGGFGVDTVKSLGGDDTIESDSFDIIDAGDGTDSIVFHVKRDDYMIEAIGFSGEVSAGKNSFSGEITHAEFLVFDDQTVDVASLLAGVAVGRRVWGSAGNDTILLSGTIDVVDGAAGLDTVNMRSLSSRFQLTREGDALKLTSSVEFSYTFTNVERIRFNDVSIAFDVAGNAGKAYRLYQAAFDRAPDLGGLGYQMHQLDIGLQLTDVSAHFIASPEFAARYGNLTNAAFVTQLYANVLDRAPDPGGLEFHLNNLDHGLPRHWLLAQFSESPENQANVIGAIQNGMNFFPV